MIRRVNVAWFQSNWLGAIRKMCHGPMHTHANMHSFCKVEIWAVLRLERFARRVQRQDDRHMVTLNEGGMDM